MGEWIKWNDKKNLLSFVVVSFVCLWFLILLCVDWTWTIATSFLISSCRRTRFIMCIVLGELGVWEVLVWWLLLWSCKRCLCLSVLRGILG